MNIKIRLLGGFYASSDEGTPLVFDTDKDRALFIYLVSNINQAIRRESLAGLLWPEFSDAAAHHNLSQAIYSLRRSFPSNQFNTLFEVTPLTLSFHPQLEGWFDFYIFNQLVNGCKQHWTNSQYGCIECLRNLESACEVYQGDFCEGLSLKECTRFEDWLRLQREIYGLKYIQLLDRLIQSLCQSGEEQRALRYAYLRVYQDPYDENSQMVLISLLLQMGWRSKALKQVEDFRKMLETEVGLEHSKDILHRFEGLFS